MVWSFGVGDYQERAKTSVASMLITRWCGFVGGDGESGCQDAFTGSWWNSESLACFLRPSLLPIPASFSGITFYWTLGPSQLLSSPCCCRKTSSASRPPLWHSLYFRCWGLLLLHFFYTSWSSPPSSRLKLLLISLIFVKLIWDFESSLALMKDDGAPSLWSQK